MAYSIFCDMVEQGVTPDVVSYNALINGLCKTSRVSEAMLLYDEMLTKGCHPDEVTFKLIIGGLLQEKKLAFGGVYSLGSNDAEGLHSRQRRF